MKLATTVPNARAPLDRGGGECSLRGEVAHHSAGKAVAGAGGVDHLVRREGGQDELTAVAVQSRQPCSPFLMTTNFGPIFSTCSGGVDQVFFSGEQAGFAVVEHQAVDLA